jgi:hypothetical protein
MERCKRLPYGVGRKSKFAPLNGVAGTPPAPTFVLGVRYCLKLCSQAILYLISASEIRCLKFILGVVKSNDISNDSIFLKSAEFFTFFLRV